MAIENKNEFLQFSVDGQLIGELGERLVTKNHIALAELVKNAYDADATHVHVELDTRSDRIIIRDNGSGMQPEVVRAHWMRIGTANKLTNPHSEKFLRRRTGNKGVGRFACQRLAKELTLVTVAEAENNQFVTSSVEFDWARYQAGINIEDVQHEMILADDYLGETGTTLTLQGLQDDWTKTDFNTLRRELMQIALARHVRRGDGVVDPGMEIELVAPEFGGDDPVILATEFMDAGWAKLIGHVDDDGVIHLQLDAKELGRKTKRIRGFPELTGVKIEIAWLPMVSGYWRKARSIRVPDLRAHLREQGGVQVFLNNFRVFPYASVGDDWLNVEFDTARRLASVGHEDLRELASQLGLDPDRSQLDMPRYRSLIGRVEIYDESAGNFLPKMDREGFVENEAFEQLRSAVRVSIDWMTVHFSYFKLLVSQRKEEQSRAMFEESVKNKPDGADTVDKALDILARPVASDELEEGPDKELRNQARDVIKGELDVRQAELALLRGLASTAPLIMIFKHEVRSVVGSLSKGSHDLEASARFDLPDGQKHSLRSLADEFRGTQKRFTQLARLFDLMGQGRKLQRKRHSLLKVLDQITTGFQLIVSAMAAKVELDVPINLKTPRMTEPELYSILVNLMSNAFKVIEKTPVRRINVRAWEEDGNFVVRFLDTGIGLPIEHREEVFLPLTYDPTGELYGGIESFPGDPEGFLLGMGSGIGLSLVRSICKKYGGKTKFIDADDPWSTCVEVVLPIRKRNEGAD